MPGWIQIAGLTLQVSIVMQVFAVGLGATWRDATYLFGQPRLLLNSILARNVCVPVIAILLIQAFPFHKAIAITLGVLAVTPVPPLLPRSQLKSGTRSEYVLGLLVSQAVLAAVLTPAAVEGMDWALAARAQVSVGRVALLVAETILVPLGAGILVAGVFPRVKGVAPRLLVVGTLLLVVGILPLLALGWKAIGALQGNGAFLAIAIFVVAGMVVGHILGGPVRQDRTALALATSARHPGIALAIAEANYPEQARLVAGAIIIYLLVRIVFSFPYLRWQRREA